MRWLFVKMPIWLVCFLLVASPIFASHAVSASYTETITPTSPQAQAVLFQEDFNDGIAQGFGNESGDWKVIDGKYTATGGFFRFSTAGDLNWQDYVLEADYSNAQDGGLLVRAKDYNNSISLIIRPTANDIGWNIRKGGAWGAGLATVALGHKPGANLHVRIEVAGSELKGYINGELKTTLKTTEFPQGKIGLYLFNQANQYWDNVVVYAAGAAPVVSPPPAAPTPAPTATPAPAPTQLGLLHQATLKDGNYRGGSAIPPTTGIVNSSEGVTFVSTEPDNQSNALINWVIPADRRAQLRSQGTISFMFKADREDHVNGEIVGENYGFGTFNNGQSTFSVASYRLPNGPGIEDDQFHIRWSTWHSAVWKYHPPAGQPNVILEYDTWYHLGFAWGPTNKFEIWVCGALRAQDSQAGAVLPWGDAAMGTGSGTNVGLGDNHERGVDQYNSAAGVTFADIRIWDEYQAYGDTQPCPGGAAPTPTPAPATPPTAVAGLVAYYPFDGDTRDYSGNGNHGTNSGAMFTSGYKGQALKFDGTDDYVSAPVNINPDVMPQMTMAVWVRADKVTGTVISHDNGGFDRSIDIDNRGGGLGWSAFSGSGGVVGFHPVTIGEWAFIAAAYDQNAKKVRLHVNDAVYEEAGTLSSGWNYIHIGHNPSFGATLPGTIDEVRIYNYALSASEIASLRAVGPAPSTPTSTPAPTAAPTPTPAPATPAPVAPPVGTANLVFESRSKTSGSTVQIPLTLRGATEKIGNMDLTLSYNPSVLQATEAGNGGLTANSLFDYNIQGATIKISLADQQGFGGDGSIAYVSFKVAGAEGSSCLLRIVDASANRAVDFAPINVFKQDGTFTVLGVEQLRGDFNGDGKITAFDALVALQMSVGKRAEDLVMDVSGDGRVTSVDARKILQMATGTVEVPTSGVTPPAVSSPTASAPTFNVKEVTTAKVSRSQGGRVAIADPASPLNGVTVDFPPGALGADTEITARVGYVTEAPRLDFAMIVREDSSQLIRVGERVEALNKQNPGYVYHPFWLPMLCTIGESELASQMVNLEPSGYSFQKPVQVKLPLSSSLPQDFDPDSLMVLSGARQKDGSIQWEVLTDFKVDSASRTVTVQANHFSPLVIVWLAVKAIKLVAVAGGAIAVGLGARYAIQDHVAAKYDLVEAARKNLRSVDGVYRDFAIATICYGKDPKYDPPQIPNLTDFLWYLATFIGNPDYNKLQQQKLWTGQEDRMTKWVQDKLRESLAHNKATGMTKEVPAGGGRVKVVPYKHHTITMADLYGKALEMTNGDVFRALLLCHNVTRGADGEYRKDDAHIQLMMEQYRGDGDDESGARYHFFGMAAYAFAVEHYKKQLAGERSYLPVPSAELAQNLEKKLVSSGGRITKDPKEYVVGLHGIDIGKNAFQKFAGWSRDQLITYFGIDPAKVCPQKSEAVPDLPAVTEGPFPAASFEGPVSLFPSAPVSLNAAGRISLTLSSSGKVSGTWKGEFIKDFKLVHLFSGSFSGSVQSPTSLSFVNVVGDYEIVTFKNDGTAETARGKWELRGMIERWVDPADGSTRVGGAQATIMDEKGFFGSWKSDKVKVE